MLHANWNQLIYLYPIQILQGYYYALSFYRSVYMDL